MARSGARVMWRATVLTIFPEMFPGPLGVSLAGKALEKKLWALDAIETRDHETRNQRQGDDARGGAGPGLGGRPAVPARETTAGGKGSPRLLMSPRGAPLTQRRIA